MNRTISFTITLTAFILLLLGCEQQPMNESVPVKITVTPSSTIAPSSSPTNTPLPTPTSTPTITPTPLGGSTGLLIQDSNCQKSTQTGKTICDGIYIYNLTLQNLTKTIFERQLLPLSPDDKFYSPSEARYKREGYAIAGVSPDRKKVVLEKSENGKTNLYTVDFEKFEQPVLLHEDVLEGESIWFPNINRIGFISKKDRVFQVFIIDPDGNNLTQMTNSPSGAVKLEKVLNEGVFWGEGTVNNNGSTNIKRFKWTKSDGTETTFTNFRAASPSGKFIITLSMNQTPDCFGCTFDMIDVVTGESKEVSLSKPNPEIDFSFPWIQPLSDDRWLVKLLGTRTSEPKYWIYSTDGSPLLAFSDIQHEHDAKPNNTDDDEDYYRIIGGDGGDLSGQRLSPDGNLLLIQHVKSDTDGSEASYYFLNLSTFKIELVPNLMYTYKKEGDIREGIFVKEFFWVEIP